MQTHPYTPTIFVAAQTPGELSNICLPVIISITLNIIFIAALVFIIIVFITDRKNQVELVIFVYLCMGIVHQISICLSHNIQHFVQSTCINSKL